MSEPSLLPPIFAPPPPVKPNRTLLYVFLTIAAVLVGLFGLAAFGLVRLSEMASKDPKPFPGFGKPKLVKRLKEGWATYAFSDLGYQITLPAKPKVEVGDGTWSADQRLVTAGWACYDASIDEYGVTFDGYDFRVDYPLTTWAKGQASRYRRNDDLKNVNYTLKPGRVGGERALVQEFAYQQQDRDAETRIYFVERSGRSYSFQFHFWADSPRRVRDGVQRIVDSVTFD